jgi:hypothetical protein
MVITDSDISTLQLVINITGILSLLGSLSTLVSIAITPRLRSPITSMIRNIAICDLISSLSFSFGNSLSPFQIPCILQAFTLQTFLISSSFWAFGVALFCYLSLNSIKGVKGLNSSLLYKFHFSSWFIPIILAIIPFSLDSFLKRGPGFAGSPYLWY